MGYVSRVGKVAQKNAILVDILVSLGAVPYVKTNGPQTIMWSETMNNLFGRTSSPFNRSFTSAGSSGGEGSLVGFRGSPLGIGTDIGGSIRSPAAYAGLYGFRSSYGRIPFAGIDDAADGQNSIRTVAGPLTTSIEGVKILMKSVIQQQPWLKDPLAVRKPWNEEEYKLTDRNGGEGLCFAIEWNDEITFPHPPITRGLEMTKSALVKAGHRVIDWKPLKHIELSRAWDDIILGGLADDVKTDIELSGEPLIEHMALEGQTPEPESYRKLPAGRSAYELWQAQKRQRALREEYLQHWNETISSTGTGRPVDAIIAPVSHGAGMPHGKNYLYDYTDVWNVLDYPALTIPVGKVDSLVDKKVPRDQFFNSRDKKVYEAYDPDVWNNEPIVLQLVGRTLEEEAVVAMSEIVDSVLKSAAVDSKL